MNCVAGRESSPVSRRKSRDREKEGGPYANILVTVAANAALLVAEVLPGTAKNIVVLGRQCCICIAICSDRSTTKEPLISRVG